MVKKTVAEKKMDKLVREKAVTKKDFTDKIEPEIWNEGALQEYLSMYKSNYPQGDEFFKNWAWKDINNMIDQVLSGEIIVQKELDTE